MGKSRVKFCPILTQYLSVVRLQLRLQAPSCNDFVPQVDVVLYFLIRTQVIKDFQHTSRDVKLKESHVKIALLHFFVALLACFHQNATLENPDAESLLVLCL